MATHMSEFSDFDPMQFFLYKQSIDTHLADPTLLFQSAGLGAVEAMRILKWLVKGYINFGM